MNRREFLKSLLAVVSSTVLLGIDLAGASDAAIDQAWDALLLNDPPSFYVYERGTRAARLGLPSPR